MKNWNWKQWTGFAILIAVIIAFVVLHFVQPVVSYAFMEFTCAGTFVLGFISGYLLNKTQKTEQINS